MKKLNEKSKQTSVIGVVPMAGLAKRLGNLGCSKEIYPVESAKGGTEGSKPKVVCEHVLEKMQRAGIDKIYIILRDGKWDIPACLGDGSKQGLNLAYLMMGLPHGTPYSIEQAYPFIQDSIVVLGFPDMIFAEEDIYTRLVSHLELVDADVALGIFPADRPEKTDMVDMADDGSVRRLVIKPTHTDLRYCWGVVAWTPVFTHFMHNYLASHQNIAATQPELFVGNVIQAGIESGLSVYGVTVSEQPFLDIGTPEDLERLSSYINKRK